MAWSLPMPMPSVLKLLSWATILSPSAFPVWKRQEMLDEAVSRLT
jgi:hypothetical protein